MQNHNSLRKETSCKILDGDTKCSLFEVRVEEPRGGLLGLKPFLKTERPLKMMKNAFYFTLEALLVLKLFKSLF